MAAPNPWMILPFALLLGAMAFAPLRAPRWWLRHHAQVALGLGAVTLGYYLFVLQDANVSWKVSPQKWAAVRTELLNDQHKYQEILT